MWYTLENWEGYPHYSLTIMDTNLDRLFNSILDFQEKYTEIKFQGASKIHTTEGLEYAITLEGILK